ncbi:tyrosine-type recombinase/integrase [Chromobacterium haemolyticum]|uniref:tyrosine-type recombinase/integrase n=2 Tax=Chromobacterium TaxID=535 RepID=UPI0018888330|nr:tyrosine-type recombinase/integrase [Chromobacterium haemolyticum]QOZ83036.1 hypothetical protein DXT74_08100 [Chromobacterium sp. Rain0013]WON83121.1 tyrosine-type recombinase/integrase [Chromobacterium haemolyticum]
MTVLSSGARLGLSLAGSGFPIFSIVDSDGLLVRTAHKWLSQLRRQAGLTFSINTVEQYGRTLSYLCRWIERAPPFPDLSIDENIQLLNRQDVVCWLSDMASTGASNKTLHSREACLRQFLEWLTTHEGGRVRRTEESPWGRDGTLRYIVATPNARSPKSISADTVIGVLNGMHNECERCMFHAQYDMGLRISELVDLKASDIPDDQLYDPTFEFIPICVNGVKGRGGQKKERITLISRAVLKRIKRYHSSREYKLAPDWDINDPNKPAFLTANQLKWSARNASKQFKASVRRASLPNTLKTHWLRHGTAFSVLGSDMGKSYQDRMLMLQQMLGHSHLKTTEIYTQISPALLENLTKKGKEINRLDEAEYIRSHTYLGPLQHKEKRGHREE